MSSPRGIRNRNPGNIVVSGWTIRQSGYTGPEKEGRFATFDTMAHGLAALFNLLLIYRTKGKKTVRAIINTWAPPVENDTSAYVLAVSKALGVQPDDELPDEPHTYNSLAHAIAQHENGRDAANAGITDRDYAEALAEVFGIEQQSAGELDLSPVESNPSSSSTTAVPTAPALGEEGSFWSKSVLPFLAALSPFAKAALPSLISAAPDLIRVLGKNGERAEQNAKTVEKVIDIAKQVTGEVTTEGAASKLQDEKIKASFQQSIKDNWFSLTETTGGVREARAADAAFIASGQSVWKSPSFIIALLLIPLVYIAMVSVALKLPFLPDWASDVRVSVINLIVGVVVGSITGYYYGMMTSKNRATAGDKDA